MIMYPVKSRSMCACVLGLGVATLAPLVPFAPLATAAPAPRGVSPLKVEAGYSITLNGFNLGSFQFKSNVGRTSYTLDTDVEISALLGVFRWKGVTRTSGAVVARIPKPADFRFDYESTVRSGSIAMGFDKDGIDRLSVLPTAMDAADTVPLMRSHLNDVLDPLSAILTITHSDASTPCARKIPIFDGKQRFDIDLRYARKEPVEGMPGEMAIVCRVKYTPIAGYRPTEETRQLAESTGIEITFRVVSAAKLMLPQSASIPTGAGHVRIDLERVNVELPEGGEVALVN